MSEPAQEERRTTPDGNPIRWRAWNRFGMCIESSGKYPMKWKDTATAPGRREHLFEFSEPIDSHQKYEPMYGFDFCKLAGQIEWVGEGPDPRTGEGGETSPHQTSTQPRGGDATGSPTLGASPAETTNTDAEDAIVHLVDRVSALRAAIVQAMEQTGTGTMHYVILRRALDADEKARRKD